MREKHMKKILDSIRNFFISFMIYIDFDDFLKRNNVEILTYPDGVAARWKSQSSYKKGVQRIIVTRVNQLIGNDYIDLTKKLKKSLKKAIRFPFFSLIGIIVSVALSILSLSEVPMFITVLGFVFGGLIFIVFIYALIQFINSRVVFASKTTITQDHIQYFLPSSLFFDVLRTDIYEN